MVNDYYGFFKQQLSSAIVSGKLTSQSLQEQYWTELNLYLDNLESFIAYKKAQHSREKQKVNELKSYVKGNSPIVIFGCGIYGKRVDELLESLGKHAIVFTDNNATLWGQNVHGKSVIKPEECFENYQEAVYIIANKKYWYDITLQLIENGCNSFYIWK